MLGLRFSAHVDWDGRFCFVVMFTTSCRWRYESLVIVCHVLPRGCFESRLSSWSLDYFIDSVRKRDEPS
jgi:hypothetical protein